MIADGRDGGALEPSPPRRHRASRRAVVLSALLAAGCSARPAQDAPPPAPSGAAPSTSAPSPSAPPDADAGPAVGPPAASGEPAGPGSLSAGDREAGLLPGAWPDPGPGTTQVVPGSTPGTGTGRRRSLRVEVEDGLPVDGAAFAVFVMATLTDPRGWSREGWDFVRTDGEADTVLTLASPQTSARMCAPLVTNGTLSCRVGGDVVLTVVRWLQGADAYGQDRTGYRQYLVSHEVGHSIGKGHAGCPGPGQPAPTMVQQSIGVGACTAQPWPYP